jgi:hypothetical protein
MARQPRWQLPAVENVKVYIWVASGGVTFTAKFVIISTTVLVHLSLRVENA